MNKASRVLANAEGGEHLSTFMTMVVMGIPAPALAQVPAKFIISVYGSIGFRLPEFSAQN